MRKWLVTVVLAATGLLAACTSSGADVVQEPVPSGAPTTVAATAAPTVPSATTATTAVPSAVPSSTAGGATGCTFSKADRPLQVALCDTFDQPAGDPARRSGDLEPILWGVSRTNTYVDNDHFNWWAPSQLEGCGATQTVTPPNDVRICDGRVFTAITDNGGQPTVAMYPKQPFDIGGGRTGTVVFDVSASSEGPHAAWPEFWWTDQPVPAPHGHLAGQAPYARNSFGFSIAQQCDGGQIGIDKMMVTRNYSLGEVPFTQTGCVDKGSPTGDLNHFEVRISQSRVEVWASDPGRTDVRQIAVADNADITMTKGLIWIEDIHYNACKDGGTQCTHTNAWDNVGFDGPTPYRDLSYDVPDANKPGDDGLVELGYMVDTEGRTFTIDDITWQQAPTGALVTFNWSPFDPFVPSVRVNGGPWHDTPWPFDEETYAWRTIAVPIDMSEMKAGTNTVEFKAPERVTVSNINVILVAAASVPTG